MNPRAPALDQLEMVERRSRVLHVSVKVARLAVVEHFRRVIRLQEFIEAPKVTDHLNVQTFEPVRDEDGDPIAVLFTVTIRFALS